jgi:cytochrome P450
MTATSAPAAPTGAPASTSLPPGPPLPSGAQTLLLWSATVPFLRACQRRYGSTFTVRAQPFGTLVYVTEPADIRAVFAGEPEVFHAGEGNALLGPVLGRRSVLVLDEDEHMRARRRLLPPFHGDSVRRYADLVFELAVAEIARWPYDEPFALAPRLRAITLEVILRAVIGVTDPARLEALRDLLRRLTDISSLLMLAWVWPALDRLGPWRRYREIKERSDRLLLAEIARRREADDLGERGDVLSLLLRAEEPPEDDELRDQIITLLLAGHETTTTGLAWTLERLVRHPATMQRARDADEDYLDATIKESLRVRPVIADVARHLTRPAEVAGRLLPAGVDVMPGIALVQASPRFHPQPEAFRPERFLDGGADMEAYTWIPFGGGRRRCLGAAFAAVEMRMVLRAVLDHARLEPTSPRPERVRTHHITLVPARGARVIRRR